MKKLLSMFIAIAMIITAVPIALAAENENPKIQIRNCGGYECRDSLGVADCPCFCVDCFQPIPTIAHGGINSDGEYSICRCNLDPETDCLNCGLTIDENGKCFCCKECGNISCKCNVEEWSPEELFLVLINMMIDMELDRADAIASIEMFYEEFPHLRDMPQLMDLAEYTTQELELTETALKKVLKVETMTINDALRALMFIVGMIDSRFENPLYFDYNCDGVVDIRDALESLMFVAGMK